MQFHKDYNIGDLRDTLEKAGFKNLVLQQLGEGKSNQYLVKFRGEESELHKIAEKTEQTLLTKMQRATSSFSA